MESSERVQSFLLLLLFLLLAHWDLVDLDHRVLELLVILRCHRTCWPNHLDDLLVLVKFSPVRSVEAIVITEVDISSVRHQQLHDLFETETRSIVQCRQPSLIAECRVGTRVQ